MNLYFKALSQYATFTGRASRAEYWTFLLINLVIKIILSIISASMGVYVTNDPNDDRTLLDGLFAMAVFIPSLAVMVRRLHDIGFSGWWILSFILGLPIIIVGLIDSKDDNKYGERIK